MVRRVFSIRIKPGTQEEYIKRHQQVWPEVLISLKKHGVSKYSIYLYDTTTIIAVMDIAGEFEEIFMKIHNEPSMINWREYMSDIIIRDENMGFHFLNEVFHLE